MFRKKKFTRFSQNQSVYHSYISNIDGVMAISVWLGWLAVLIILNGLKKLISWLHSEFYQVPWIILVTDTETLAKTLSPTFVFCCDSNGFVSFLLFSWTESKTERSQIQKLS